MKLSWVLAPFLFLVDRIDSVMSTVLTDEMRRLDDNDDVAVVTDASSFAAAIQGASGNSSNPSTILVDAGTTIDFDNVDIQGLTLDDKYFSAICGGYNANNKCTLKRMTSSGRFFHGQDALDVSFKGFKFEGGNAPGVDHTHFEHNGGAFAFAIDMTGSLSATFTDCDFEDNEARRGGAFYYYSFATNEFNPSSLVFTGCTFRANTANDRGGAINMWAHNPLSRINLIITQCSFSDNDAGGKGNDIFGDWDKLYGKIYLTCSETTTSGTGHDVKKVGMQQKCSTTAVPSNAPSAVPSDSPSALASSVPSSLPTSFPSASPSIATNAPTTRWEEITFDDFKRSSGSRGWGNFRKHNGSSDATRIGRNARNVDVANLPNGSPALRIREQGVRSAVWHKSNHDVTAYSNLRVSFTFRARGMGQYEFFVLEYSSNGGSSWDVIEQFFIGPAINAYENGAVHNVMVDFNAEDKAYETDTSRARIRFRCVADDTSKYIYIDDVSFEGCVGDC